MPFFFIKKINMVISSKTYNPDCDPVQDDTQKELDQLDRPAEPDATDAVLAEMEANRFELALEDAKASDEFLARAEKFRTERSKAWQEFLEISAEAGYAIEDNLANRSLFMGGYESGKEAASVDRRAIDKWQSMESAPKTGEHIQVINVNGYGFGFCGGKRQHASDVVHWFVDGFYSSVFGTDQETPMTFTHWRPLPDMAAVLAEMEVKNANS